MYYLHIYNSEKEEGSIVLPFEDMQPMINFEKNSRGVRGMKLEDGDSLEHVYFPENEPLAVYKEKEVHLNRLKMAKRDGKGTKTRV